MEPNNYQLPILLLIPLIGAVAAPFMPDNRTTRRWALLASLATAVYALYIAIRFFTRGGSGTQFIFLGGVFQVHDIGFAFSLGIDAIGVDKVLSASNVGRGPGSSFTFRITAKASVKSVTVGGATANFRSVPESFGNSQIDASVKRDLQRVTVTLPAPVAGGGSLVMNINYNLPVESNSGLAAISPNESQFLPLSFWYPLPNTLFTVRGADTAPV